MFDYPLSWFEIYVQDMPRATAFTGALVKMDGAPSGFARTLVYRSCQDCAVEAQRAVEAGGSIFKPKSAIGEYGPIALLYDTEGNMIGLSSMQ